MIELAVFYIFGALLLGSATMVVVIRNPVYAALFLILAFLSSAVIWLLLQAEFLALILVLVYVGAVMVLFLFVVMMLDINLVTIREGFARYMPIGIIVAVLMAVAMGLVVSSDYFLSDTFTASRQVNADYSNTLELGQTLYTRYLYQFEIAGVILLVAIVAAISLGMDKSKTNKVNNPSKQVCAQKRNRLRIIKLEVEKKS